MLDTTEYQENQKYLELPCKITQDIFLPGVTKGIIQRKTLYDYDALMYKYSPVYLNKYYLEFPQYKEANGIVFENSGVILIRPLPLLFTAFDFCAPEETVDCCFIPDDINYRQVNARFISNIVLCSTDKTFDSIEDQKSADIICKTPQALEYLKHTITGSFTAVYVVNNSSKEVFFIGYRSHKTGEFSINKHLPFYRVRFSIVLDLIKNPKLNSKIIVFNESKKRCSIFKKLV